MQGGFRTAHRVVGGVTVLAFLLTGMVSAPLLFFAFYADPMAARPAGSLSASGLYALLGGVILHTAASLGRTERRTA